MDAFSKFMLFVIACYAGDYLFRWWLANNHPSAYESYKRIEAERRQGIANAAMKSAKTGFNLYRFLRR